jgi:hypothetical protein
VEREYEQNAARAADGYESYEPCFDVCGNTYIILVAGIRICGKFRRTVNIAALDIAGS